MHWMGRAYTARDMNKIRYAENAVVYWRDKE